MDQYQSWGKVLTNFQGHWSIQIFVEYKAPWDWSIRMSPHIHVDTNLYEVLVYNGIGPWTLECSSLLADANSGDTQPRVDLERSLEP